MRSRHLVCHIFIRNFGDGRHEEDPGQNKDEYTDSKVYPLYALQSIDIIRGVGKENVRSQCWRNNSPDPVESLG